MKSIKQWVIIHFATEIKILTILIMLVTAGIMLYDRCINSTIMPNFYQMGKHDWYFWFWANVSGVVINVSLLTNTTCIKCRLISDLMLQLSGFLILLMGWIFLALYPPLNVFMVTYSVWGVLIIIAGRYMGKHNRKLKQLLG